ncbi:type I restriction enzyme HsdR N-terminal domain-containing protein [Shewanella yunxiaonensis]|uniref:Type I restriction enzyme HsdR N-terminal domain-containing protein n=1 Tax=Shewanella yunxiaonensis TaxID=2829809 RepID=A0ABX7YXU7_9GAMM|nr:type I restriction endonuclease [Shewanella yunxiaonensis]QUN07298.1 type I restriction enzyme HsdR N-terminal domain-containing protein [Shewanella yunxiaonensis]
MEFAEHLQVLSKKAIQIGASLETEEATKNALVMPFLHSVLGYDVFDPGEVVPEFTADTATKKGEKVDYAILKDGAVQILIECKRFGEKLALKHAGQLFRYFSVTNARIAILTNGHEYQLFTDLDAPNKMDEKPFLVLDLLSIDEHLVPEVKKLTKQAFDVESVVGAAGELKYLSAIKRLLDKQFQEPEEELVKFLASHVYDGVLSPKVKQQFTVIVKKALKQFLSDSVNDRLKNALTSQDTDDSTLIASSAELVVPQEDDKDSKIETTQEEIDGYNVVKAILRAQFEVGRIVARDTQSYFGVLLDDNNRKPLCRLHFNGKSTKYVGLFDEDKNETVVAPTKTDSLTRHFKSSILSR